ncbi:MAG: methyltransferase domain-containing protein [Ktedonobacteraceae bacterium]
MIDNQPVANAPAYQTKKIPIQERSVRVGEVIVVNGHGVNQTSLKQRFAEGGYQAQQTTHFLLFTREAEPKTILVHSFKPEEINSNIVHYLVQELKPFNIIPHSEQLGELLAGIIGGTVYPGDVRRAWNYFGANTLQRLLVYLGSAIPSNLPDYGTIGVFATLYQRVCELCVGERFLDVGCNSGLLSLLLAERIPFMREAVGIDIDPDAFKIGQEIAAQHQLTNVRYIQADLLAGDFSAIGMFDTVTALHVLEHINEKNMYQVLTNLLKVTAHRLIFAVPYETDEPEAALGHQQLFTRAKLEAVGAWCVEQLQGAGRIWYEDLCGGLLLIERFPY